MQGIFQKENTDKSLKYGIYRHLPTYEKIIRNLVSFYNKKTPVLILRTGIFIYYLFPDIYPFGGFSSSIQINSK